MPSCLRKKTTPRWETEILLAGCCAYLNHRLTCDCKVTDEFIRVFGLQPLRQVNINELSPDDWSNIKAFVFVQNAAEFQWGWVRRLRFSKTDVGQFALDLIRSLGSSFCERWSHDERIHICQQLCCKGMGDSLSKSMDQKERRETIYNLHVVVLSILNADNPTSEG